MIDQVIPNCPSEWNELSYIDNTTIKLRPLEAGLIILAVNKPARLPSVQFSTKFGSFLQFLRKKGARALM